MRVIASQFLPKDFWLYVAGAVGGCALVVLLSFWVAVKFGGSWVWVTGGLLLGIAAAVNWWHPAMFIAGAAAGAVLGCAASLIVGAQNR